MKISCDAIHSNCCGIYLIRNNINNKVYIGQSVDITYKHLPIWNSKEQRWIEPCIDYSSGSFK